MKCPPAPIKCDDERTHRIDHELPFEAIHDLSGMDFTQYLNQFTCQTIRQPGTS